MDRNLARRLKEARRETGLSARAVAMRLPKRVAVSYVTIASYENGTTMPPIDVLAALADLYGRPLNWFLETRESLSAFRYRNLKSKIGVLDKRQFEAVAAKWVDGYVNLERHLDQPLRSNIGGIVIEAKTLPKALAMAIRKELGARDDQPIHNMVEVLEHTCAVRVLEMKTELAIDGAAAKRGCGYVVLLNPSTKGDRMRLNAGHELAHALYDDCGERCDVSASAAEQRAYEFASSLLLPESQLQRAFEGKSFLRLLQFKEKFGISISAMIYRAERSRIIRSTTARWLWMEMSQRGWRTKEPGYVAKDRAIRFEALLEGAIQSRTLTWTDAEMITGIRETDLRKRLSDVVNQADSPQSSRQKGENLTERETVKFPVTDRT